MFSKEKPASQDYGTPEWNAKYAKLQKIIADKIDKKKKK